MRARRLALAAVLGLALAPRAGAERDAPDERHWAWPDHGKVQLAGTIGFLSAGVGWNLAGERVELDLLAGWVPARYVGDALFTFTAKVTWLPWRVSLGRGFTLRPLTGSAAVTYTAGDRFWVVLPDRYPRGYYELPSALRGSLAVGGTIGRGGWGLQELALYWEVVAPDVALAYWITNRGPVDAADVLSLALGLRAGW